MASPPLPSKCDPGTIYPSGQAAGSLCFDQTYLERPVTYDFDFQASIHPINKQWNGTMLPDLEVIITIEQPGRIEFLVMLATMFPQLSKHIL